MSPATTIQLSDKTQNIIENLASRLAHNRGGRITPSHVLPYLPVSLGIIRAALDQMVDGTAVVANKGGDYIEYEFAACKDASSGPSILTVESCAACDASLNEDEGTVLCKRCTGVLTVELGDLAESTGWPAQAVYEHEFLYHAAEKKHALLAGMIAATSRYTLRSTTKKLGALSAANHIHEDLDRKSGTISYQFPAVEYPRSYYDANMAIIMTYPSSIMEETEIKIMRILAALGLLFLACLVAGFFGIPFPILTVLIAVVGPVIAVMIWRHKKTVKD